MLISRGVITFRALKRLPNVHFKQAVRNSGHGGAWHYRTGSSPPSKGILLSAEIVGGVAWWWVLWHLWTEPGHILGEFEYPDARKWTDEELGIPEELEIE